MLGLLPLLAVSQTRSCSSCDAGEACGICLMLVPANQCPSGRYDQQGNGLSLANDCRGLAVGSMCEADGECGTNNDANNCPSRWSTRGGLDVYIREACVVTQPRPPPPPPIPACLNTHCDAGSSCGVCLQALSSADPACPPFWRSDWVLFTCDKVGPGELCEADGECGTLEVNNCAGRDPGSSGQTGSRTAADVYRRVNCAYPPPPPAAPSPPPVMCGTGQCAAGSSCGICLEEVQQSECPMAWRSDFRLPTCDIAAVGAMCEGDGECGTSNVLNNCRGGDSSRPSWGSWRQRNADVYRVRDCVVPGAISPPPPPPPGTSPALLENDELALVEDELELEEEGGGMNGFVVFLLVVLGLGGCACAVFIVLRIRHRGQLGGSPTMRPSQRVVINPLAPVGGISTSMTAPLSLNAAPIGVGMQDVNLKEGESKSSTV